MDRDKVTLLLESISSKLDYLLEGQEALIREVRESSRRMKERTELLWRELETELNNEGLSLEERLALYNTQKHGGERC
ncbi:hypothetical protein [Geomonas ferrireducens]|uniref:hypothetical protein n=1 Tax=Geomonas ferrireducens TaxID=2570227 RepID=UPI0010A8B461|nr:hypothetical protein [Geomonas ferrireducens]